MSRALVLNATYEPLCVVPQRRAAVLVLADKADVLHAGDAAFHSERLTVPAPSVIKLRYFVKVPYERAVSLNRRSVFARDESRCQYCGDRADSIDHVVPRSRGGEHAWENVVAACRPCNLRKGDRYLHETAMRLFRHPAAPAPPDVGGGRGGPGPGHVGAVPATGGMTRGDGVDPDLFAEVELRRVRLPLVTPHVTWTTELREREVILVRLELGSGSVGWGECPTFPAPTYTADYTDAAWAVLRDILLPPMLAGTTPPPTVGHHAPKGALLDAVADARQREAGRSAVDRLSSSAGGGAPATSVPTTTVLSGWADLDDLLQRAEAAVRAGAAMVKVKLGRDLDPLWALRSTFPSVLLAADLNGPPDIDPRDELFAEIDRLGLAYLEQPLPVAGGWDDLLDLCGRMETPIALDESVTDLAAAEAALLLGAASIVNVKPGRVGGTAAAAALVARCEQAGAAAFVGGMLETGVGRAHALAVAALPGCTLPTDLGPSSQYFTVDLTEPIERRSDGTLPVPRGPGIGVVPDPDRLEAATVDRLTFRP